MQTEKHKGVWSNFLVHGGAGILTVLVIVLLFILCVTWFQPLIFALMLAALFLPLEKFYERLLFPKDKNKEITKKQVACASAVSILSFILALILIICTILLAVVPMIKDAKDMFGNWSTGVPSLSKLETSMQSWLHKTKYGQQVVTELKGQLNHYNAMLADILVDKGKFAVSFILNLFQKTGKFSFNFLLTLFFFFYFLQKMAMYRPPEVQKGRRASAWLVSGLFDSPWLPHLKLETKVRAAEILSHIGIMLQRWLRGYCTIIVIESLLYSIGMAVVGVPFALLAGVVAGCSVLVPIVGIIASVVLTFSLCLIFAQGNVIIMFAACALVYGIVIAIEQSVLYPRFIGGAMGLTTLETIIVVLAGGSFFGVAGMLLALPSAAVAKYLIPEIYQSIRSENMPSAPKKKD